MSWQHFEDGPDGPNNDPIKKLAGVVAVFSFVADLILMFILIGTLLGLNFLYSSQPITIQILLIVIIYLFALILFIYGRSGWQDRFEAVVYLLAWIYVILAAILWMIVSYRFVANFAPDLGVFQFLFYSVSILAISSFGTIIARIVNEPVRHFAWPFLLVTVWQIGLWVWRVASDAAQGWPTGWNLAGSILLFVFVVFYIFMLLKESQNEEEA